MKTQIDIKTDKIESGLVYAPFNEAVTTLHDEGFELIALPTNAQLRIYGGRQSKVTTNGNYTIHGVIYAKNSEPLVDLMGSPLVSDGELAERAVKANKKGKYFRTANRAIYDEKRAIAEEDLSKSPEERRVIIFPSRGNIELSSTANPETFKALFKNTGEPYLKFIDQDNLIFYPVDSGEVDSKKDTLLTQLWFVGHGGFVRSGLGGGGDLYGSDRVRGVRPVTGEATQKISEDRKSELYTSEQIREYKELVNDVRSGTRPNADLKELSDFLETLDR